MAIPQSFLDDPFLTVPDIMAILKLKRSKVYHIVRTEMKHYKDKKNVRVRMSWLQKWIDEHTEEPSE